jgi:hypothetical protein
MEQNITISLSLPISEACRVLNYLKNFTTLTEAPEGETPENRPSDSDTQVSSSAPPPSAPIHFQPVFLSSIRPELRQLLDEQLLRLLRFVLRHDGSFYNRDLALELGVDTPLTSIYLGHLTRKLQKVGVDGKNWYQKHRTTSGTLLTVRDDVMKKFAETIEDQGGR